MSSLKLEQIIRWHVGIKIQANRVARGLTQYDLARKAKVERATIAMIETGRQGVSWGKLYRIARALNVPAKALLPSLGDIPKETWK